MASPASLDTNLITLSRHVLHEQVKYRGKGDLTMLLVSIQVACKFISANVRRAGLINLTGLAADTHTTTSHQPVINVQGETVKKLDVLSNDIFINSLKSTGKVKLMVSEEVDNAIWIEDAHCLHDDNSISLCNYCVVFDPLDGSSNIDAGVSIGSIFGIYHVKAPGNDLANVLRPGSELIAAGYAMYGSFTSMVLSTGHGTHGYTLDPTIGEFVLTNPNIHIPVRGKIYSVNEGNQANWHPGTRAYFESLKKPISAEDSADIKTYSNELIPTSRPGAYSARYIGSMVADVHRTLLYGGIFAYPADLKSPQGKLRLLYECFPMAFIVEQAGGRASTGAKRILDLVPTKLHERSPIVLGSKDDVLEYEAFNRKYQA